jgi:IclR family pca regulon transcriptional regulator
MPRLKRNAEEQDVERGGPEIIESLDRGLRVLQLFGADHRPMPLTDIAKAANLPRATTRRILQTFVRSGLVDSDGKLFQLTPRVLSLASAYLSSNQVVAVMQPLMDRVSTETREVCSMAILDGDEVVFIARASPARVFSAGIDIGYRLPAFCTSVGRALLGRFPNEELVTVLGRMTLVAQTPFTVVDQEVLVAAIITDRSKGYSLVDQEAEAGFRSLAVPVHRYDGEIVAAVNVGSHVDRISTGEMIDRFLPPLQKAATAAQPLLM